MIAERMVIRIYFRAAGIADTRTDNAWQTPEPGVGTPESAKGKSCNFRFYRRIGNHILINPSQRNRLVTITTSNGERYC